MMYSITQETISLIHKESTMTHRKAIAAFLCMIMLTSCGQVPAETEAPETEPAETTEAFVLGDDGFLPEYETFELTSEDLTDGVWADVISWCLAAA